MKAQAKEAGNQPTTIYTKLIILRSLVRFAFRRKMTPTDPLEGYKIKKVKPRPQPCWSWEDSQRILDASPERWKPLFTFLRETGCRIGEAVHLTWVDVQLDAEQPYVHIRAKEDWRPKTGDERKIPLTSRGAVVLRGLSRRGPNVFEYQPTRRSKTPTRGNSTSVRTSHYFAAHTTIKKVLAELGPSGRAAHVSAHLHFACAADDARAGGPEVGGACGRGDDSPLHPCQRDSGRQLHGEAVTSERGGASAGLK